MQLPAKGFKLDLAVWEWGPWSQNLWSLQTGQSSNHPIRGLPVPLSFALWRLVPEQRRSLETGCQQLGKIDQSILIGKGSSLSPLPSPAPDRTLSVSSGFMTALFKVQFTDHWEKMEWITSLSYFMALSCSTWIQFCSQWDPHLSFAFFFFFFNVKSELYRGLRAKGLSEFSISKHFGMEYRAVWCPCFVKKKWGGEFIWFSVWWDPISTILEKKACLIKIWSVPSSPLSLPFHTTNCVDLSLDF